MGHMDTVELSVDTTGRPFTDLTPDARSFSGRIGGDGLLHVFAPHATAGLALFELGAGSEADVAEAIGRLLPAGRSLAAPARLAGHGADHVLPGVREPVDGRAGARRHAGARDVAVDRPRRPQPGQPAAEGAAQPASLASASHHSRRESNGKIPVPWPSLQAKLMPQWPTSSALRIVIVGSSPSGPGDLGRRSEVPTLAHGHPAAARRWRRSTRGRRRRRR